ncbi:hypothetical protein SELMODRAFT_428822 [Selaginella moellendorffii]|uniref:Uncharacterized protein ABI5D-2 n=1 Tax=Selaginella moellendorffii TaxID=88036 RepID=D8T444_SELML|nr:ABSCISIC ACID-INSENSITIVE 5-like protein 5 [Selaginella moellendorffii]EFJ08641.1 hypothetical protein SELMODRAFT_428822 [Selaginella moellendorffii]|eukprot:XP_002990372.1 ABSCISIC ACID-INSENSITIVE 5-like protein 5 [Selaginella moellendorffii]
MGAVSAEYLNSSPVRPVLDDLKSFGVPEKKFSSMNIDELLVAATGEEESQPSLPSSSEQEEEENPSSSEIKLSVEEVWREIQEGKLTSTAAASSTEAPESGIAPQRTLGEMTLEEFLVKSGVADSAPTGIGSTFPDLGPAPHKRERDDLELAYMQGMDPSAANSSSKRLRAFVTKIEECCMVPSGGQVLSYGDAFHKPDEYVDKVAERRQRRMIKNRESAARSRARKQAYTAELEAEVTLLKEENDKLKRQQAEDARYRAKVIDMLTVLKRSKKNAKARRVELRRVNSF